MKKKIYFSKMHSLGNDFVIINNLKKKYSFNSQLIRNLSDRNLGIGFDQLLIVEKPKIYDCDFFYRIFNSDGKEVYQCGNGARCFAHYVFLKDLINKKKIRISTKKSILNISNIDTIEIKVNMGSPIFDPKKIPILTPNYQRTYTIPLKKVDVTCSVLSLGNPHCVIDVKDTNSTNVEHLGSLISNHVMFPDRINVGFMQIVNACEFKLRVYERGSGETKACGSGACAATVIGILQGKLKKNKNIKVKLLGGCLYTYWDDKKQCIHIKGPSVHVYDGCAYV